MEIAALLECSYQTVRRYLGPQPKRKRDTSAYVKALSPKPAKSVHEPIEPPVKKPTLMQPTGKSFTYRDGGTSFFVDVRYDGFATILSGLNKHDDAGLKIKMDKIAPLIAMLHELEALYDEYKAAGLL